MMTGFKITAVITTHVCFEYISELFRVLLDLMITRIMKLSQGPMR